MGRIGPSRTFLNLPANTHSRPARLQFSFFAATFVAIISSMLLVMNQHCFNKVTILSLQDQFASLRRPFFFHNFAGADDKFRMKVFFNGLNAKMFYLFIIDFQYVRSKEKNGEDWTFCTFLNVPAEYLEWNLHRHWEELSRCACGELC